ncbi:MAG: bifunctional glutamate N-acetyltransferase/amino-acid acetyltransferase ArgJ [Spirochaetia bacterium]|nr:bifunctional glutamate N-acetyltransferase/amino-acid acetyltransferase ArgJ [Spirochaetia bacterium]
MISKENIEWLPVGYKSYAVSCGIKDDTLDLGIIVSEKEASVGAVFTQNKICGAAVVLGRERIKNGKIQAVVVNSKNANVATGERGKQDAEAICRAVSDELDIDASLVFPSSTGVIGRPLPVDKLKDKIKNLKQNLSHRPDFASFTKAIMTTDTFPKYISKKIGNVSLVGVAKGAGMIEPNMATMLAYFFTDAEIDSNTLQKMLNKAVDVSFNSLSIDSDMSTSDTALIMANGICGEVDETLFQNALTESAVELAKMIAFDAEGATKLFVVDVEGAADDAQAKKIGKSVINSPLVKTAIYQGDPNWGRIFMAIGKTPDVEVEEEKIEIFWNSKKYGNDELSELSRYIKENREIYLKINLNLKDGKSRVYGCDLTEEYVRINAYYTT